jgi:hypothetical protein
VAETIVAKVIGAEMIIAKMIGAFGSHGWVSPKECSR